MYVHYSTQFIINIVITHMYNNDNAYHKKYANGSPVDLQVDFEQVLK